MYDRFGELTSVSNALGQSLRHERDARGRITATRQPDGSKECYQLDPAGRITQIQAQAPDGQGTSKNRRFQPATVSSGLKSSGLPVL